MSEVILKVNNMCKYFESKGVTIRAVNDISFEIEKGETVGIVGESGCGKTTLGRTIVGAYVPSSGSAEYTAADGEVYDLSSIDKKKMKELRKEIQMIFQDPYSSLDPRMTVFDIISEPLRANFKLKKEEIEEKVKFIAEKVGLKTEFLKRYPHAFSGGQRQRIGIARALVMYPRLIICDEAVSALDVSVQAQVVNLLKDLQKDMDLTYIFISHDLSVVEHISDRVGVMYLGRMVEYADTASIFEKPMHPYTEALLSAVPIPDPDMNNERIPLAGEIPNPANPPKGCPFHTRCRYCTEKCKTEVPEFKEREKGHFVACHLTDTSMIKGIIKQQEGM
ncbi:MAG: dipeptide ABC transporter ATP-binding protein [Lachnospiraceae bacterium]|nr:dipeptide ABC transporter ATP-binding protein [Lachnospiraceae bacterium]